MVSYDFDLECLRDDDFLETQYLTLNAKAIANALKVNDTITHLGLSWKKLGDEGAIEIANALEDNNTITHLGLSWNEIGDKGAIALAKALKGNKTLMKLNLGDNMIGDEGAIALAKALKGNTTLEWLSLCTNCIGDDGAIALANTLKDNSTIGVLELGHNNDIGNKAAKLLANALKHNSTLYDLDLSYNMIGDDGAIALANALGDRTSAFGYLRNNFGDWSAAVLANNLKYNSTLEHLHLYQTNIGDELQEQIRDLLARNQDGSKKKRKG